MATTPVSSRHAGSPDVVATGAVPADRMLVATARLLGTRAMTRQLAEDPAFLRAGQQDAKIFVFRFGVAVLFAPADAPLLDLAALLAPHIAEPSQHPETESTTLVINPEIGDRIAADGTIVLADVDIERLQLVATVLARSVVLARHETLVSQTFEISAPLVADLRENGRVGLRIREVMKIVGNALFARHRVIGAVEAGERPDLLWDHPELDRLYARLEAEYELQEREKALDRKFVALGAFGEALLDIVQEKRAFRLEAVIIALIAIEIVISLADMALR